MIKKTVGSQGQNDPTDVYIVQLLLGRLKVHLGPLAQIKVTGICDSLTISYIKAFQNIVCKYDIQTGTLLPNGMEYLLLRQNTDIAANEAYDVAWQVVAVEATAANFARIFIKEASVRRQYIAQATKFSREVLDDLLSGRISPQVAAETAHALRNELLDFMRNKSTSVGRAYAESLKAKGRPLSYYEEKYANDLFKKTFDRLSHAERNKVWAKIVERSGAPQAGASRTAVRFGIAGRVLLAASIGIAIYNIYNAEDKVKALKQETATLGGGILGGAAGGAAAGLFCGPGAPVCVGLGVFIGGIMGALGANYYFVWKDEGTYGTNQ